MKETIRDLDGRERSAFAAHGPIDRDLVLREVLALKEAGVKDPTNINDEKVKAVSDLFEAWSRQESPYVKGENNEDGLRFALMQDMIAFDAGWVNDVLELESIKADLEQRLEDASEFNFQTLKMEVKGHLEAVESKLESIALNN